MQIQMFSKEKSDFQKILLLSILGVLFCCISFICNLTPTSYATSLCFLLGIYWKYFEQKIYEIVKLDLFRYILIVCFSLVAVTGSLFFKKYFIYPLSDVFQIILTSILFTIVTLLIFFKLKCGGKLIKGTLSFEIYVFQGVFFILLQHFEIYSSITKILLIIIGTIILSIIFHPVFNKIRNNFSTM